MLPTIPEGFVWAILLLPVASLLTIGFLTKPYPRLSGYVTIAAIGTAFAFSLWALDSSSMPTGIGCAFGTLRVADGRPTCTIDLALNLDGLSAIMLVVVTSVSLLVQIYSQGYMHGDTGYSRYFAWMSLFTAAMLGLVLFDSILIIYVFWELVGLGSYLLIGFWFHKTVSRRRGEEGVPDDAPRRHRLPARHPADLDARPDTFNIPVLQEMALRGEVSDTVITLVRAGLLRRRRRQVGAVPAARLAARRDGGPDAGLRPHPRRDDGRGRRVPRRAHVPGVPGVGRRA